MAGARIATVSHIGGNVLRLSQADTYHLAATIALLSTDNAGPDKRQNNFGYAT